ncbi:VOC family protein [Rhodococcus sp. B10]|uniref:VOC family protein n=1 Tax=Rhodococcus sp. B10 TaxID=2695876 RepID=UPI00142F4EDD|nr:Virulence protein [Rhodococcus sp. B10]
MNIDRLDHLVLTVADIGASIDFYVRVLGMREETFREGRKALTFGASKINLHEAGHEFEPKAHKPTPGSADLCFVVTESITDVAAELKDHGIAVEDGPVERTGARGSILSVYIRDPDNNLIELSNYR